jgi:hypothetical protein
MDGDGVDVDVEEFQLGQWHFAADEILDGLAADLGRYLDVDVFHGLL